MAIFEDYLFNDLPDGARVQMLEDNCTKIEHISYNRKFSEEETDEMRRQLTDDLIEINKTQDQIDHLVEPLKQTVKKLEKRTSTLLMKLTADHELVQEDCFKFTDYENGMVAYYNSDGLKVKERPMLSDEKQKTIGDSYRESKLSKTGTNN